MVLEKIWGSLRWRDDWESRIIGGVLGLAVGDALGLPWEFMERSEVEARFRGVMVGGGSWDRPPGTWSDDTGQTLALIDAIARGGGIEDVARALLEWFEGRYGPVFDVGLTTRRALERLASGVSPEESGVKRPSCGSLMRSYPASVYSLCMPLEEALDYVHRVGRITHSHPASVLATGLYTIVVRGLFAGLSLRESVAAAGEALRILYTWAPKDVRKAFRYLFNWRDTLRDPGRGSCFAPNTLRAALWSVATGKNFREAVVKAVMLGDDTDTVAAIAGSLAGTIYGATSIPRDYLETLQRRELVESRARLLARLVREKCSSGT